MVESHNRKFWSLDVSDMWRIFDDFGDDFEDDREAPHFYPAGSLPEGQRPDENYITEIDTDKLARTARSRYPHKPSEPGRMDDDKTIQEKLKDAKFRISRLEKALDFLANKVISAERNAILHQLRLEYVFDEAAEQKLCHYAKMSDAQFKKHCAELRASCPHERSQRTLWPEAELTQSFPFLTPTADGMDEQKLLEDFRRIPPGLQLYALEFINTMANAVRVERRDDEGDEDDWRM